MGKPLLKIEKLLLCDNAFLSSDNKLNIIGILDIIYTDKVPATHPLIFLVGMISGKPNFKDKLLLELTDPKGKKLLADKEIGVGTSFTGKGNFIVRIPILKLDEYGIYKVSVLKDRHILATTSFSLIRLGGQSGQERGEEFQSN